MRRLPGGRRRLPRMSDAEIDRFWQLYYFAYRTDAEEEEFERLSTERRRMVWRESRQRRREQLRVNQAIAVAEQDAALTAEWNERKVIEEDFYRNAVRVVPEPAMTAEEIIMLEAAEAAAIEAANQVAELQAAEAAVAEPEPAPIAAADIALGADAAEGKEAAEPEPEPELPLYTVAEIKANYTKPLTLHFLRSLFYRIIGPTTDAELQRRLQVLSGVDSIEQLLRSILVKYGMNASMAEIRRIRQREIQIGESSSSSSSSSTSSALQIDYLLTQVFVADTDNYGPRMTHYGRYMRSLVTAHRQGLSANQQAELDHIERSLALSDAEAPIQPLVARRILHIDDHHLLMPRWERNQPIVHETTRWQPAYSNRITTARETHPIGCLRPDRIRDLFANAPMRPTHIRLKQQSAGNLEIRTVYNACKHYLQHGETLIHNLHMEFDVPALGFQTQAAVLYSRLLNTMPREEQVKDPGVDMAAYVVDDVYVNLYNNHVVASMNDVLNLPMGVYKEPAQVDDCSICTDALHATICRQLPCGHIFHMRCIDKWLLRDRGECPICRARLPGVKEQINYADMEAMGRDAEIPFNEEDYHSEPEQEDPNDSDYQP
jgi:hypothetical protein